MPSSPGPAQRRVYMIIDSSAIPLPNPAWRDENDRPIIYQTEHEAEVEIAEWMIDKLNEFIAGERDFHDATTCTDFVLAVDLTPRV